MRKPRREADGRRRRCDSAGARHGAATAGSPATASTATGACTGRSGAGTHGCALTTGGRRTASRSPHRHTRARGSAQPPGASCASATGRRARPGSIVIDRVADTEVELGWGAERRRQLARSSATAIFRNGAPVAQVAAPSIVRRQPRARHRLPLHGRGRRQLGLRRAGHAAGADQDRDAAADARQAARVHARHHRRELRRPAAPLPADRHGLPDVLRLPREHAARSSARTTRW